MRTYGTCRGCKAKLVRANYVRFGLVDSAAEEKASGVSRRHDGDVYSWIHTPCPYCNEPRPMSRRWRGLAVAIGFLAALGIALWVEFGG
jgi:hypothetical protein